MIHRFKRSNSKTAPVVPSGGVWDRLVSKLEWICSLQVGGGLRMEAGPSGPIIIGAPGGVTYFPVRVEQTGGVQGSPTTRATWTYTVRDFTYNGELASGEDDPILGTGVVVADPRPIGRMLYQDGDVGIGWAFYDTDGTLKLWEAGEREDTGFCSQLESPDASGS